MLRERDIAEEKEDLDDFLKDVNDYLEQPAATEKEGALKSEILGYLSLIEERPKESFKLPEIRVGKIPKDVFLDQVRPEQIGSREGAAAVGKLDTSAMFQASDETKKPVVSVSKDGCKSVRAALEHKMSGTINNNESVTLKNYTRKRIVHIGANATETAAEEGRECKKTEWKWKNKGPEIAALQQFVRSNKQDLSGGIVNRRRNEATIELEKKSEELAKNLEAKEREFQVGVIYSVKVLSKLKCPLDVFTGSDAGTGICGSR